MTTPECGAFVTTDVAAGDVLMIPAGCEHGSDGPNTFAMNAVIGTLAPGAHPPGHYYVEESGYLPSLSLVRTPSERYPTGSPYRSDPRADRSGWEVCWSPCSATPPQLHTSGW